MINYNITETFVWFDMPQKFDRFCYICKVLEELIEKAYGAFKSPEDVTIGFIWKKEIYGENFLQIMCPYVTFSRMHDCESQFEIDELIGKKERIYQIFYSNAFDKEYSLEEIEKMERDYMLRQIKKNK